MVFPLQERPHELGRREFISAGSLSLIGLGLPLVSSFRAEAAPSGGTTAPAKRCIFLFAWGGPSQIDTLDPKPNAPKEVRGEFEPIATRTPGIFISEHFRRLAQHSDKLAIVRSLTHDDPAHLSSGHLALTGHLAPVVKSDAEPPSERDTPHLGSVLAQLRGSPGNLPSFVTMPWYAAHSAAPGGRAPGQTGGWLGPGRDPFLVTGDPSRPDWKVSSLELFGGVSTDRMRQRNALLDSFEHQHWGATSTDEPPDFQWRREQAIDLLTSPLVRSAFDITQEPQPIRDRYGRHIFGQNVLLARRLIEHGVPVVSVNWHDDGKNYWDCHGDVFNRLRNDLIPPTDQALSALLEDLDRTGLLKDTLVVWVGEFGRSPLVNASAGREHHPFCYSGLLAGGPIAGGQTYGTSDPRAHYPATLPVQPQDFMSTILLALGIDEEATIADRTGRPHRIHAGKPLRELFG